MSPVNSLSACKYQIKAGADEIYVGMDMDTFQNIGFNGRGRYDFKGEKISPEFDELKKIVEFAHKSKVTVNYAANTVFMSNSRDDEVQKAFIEYIDKGIQAGVNQVIIGDLGNLMLLREKGFHIPVVASVFFSSFNLDTINFLKNFNVIRAVLPHHMKLSEIREIKENVDIEIEIFAGVGCSNIDGRCGFMHNAGENIALGIPCKAKYMMDNGYQGTILDATLDCLLCSLPLLIKMKIDVLKIIGRDQDVAFTSAITKIHKDLISQIENGKKITINEIAEYLEKIPWWKEAFCNNKKCKYKNVPIVRSFI
jgi:putative protease